MRILFFLLIIIFFLGLVSEAQIPNEAYRYRRILKAEVDMEFGPGYPRDIFAAQIHQESYWRSDARSRYASGLGQQTPQTESWLNEINPELRALRSGALNPRWSIRALVWYDHWLRRRTDPTGRYAPDSEYDCSTGDDWWARTLAAYNGGLGWVQRETKSAVEQFGCDPSCYFRCTQYSCERNESNCEETWSYVERILFLHRPKYLTF